MYGGDCGTPLPAKPDFVLDVYPYSITQTELNPIGYTYFICYSCDIKPTGLPIITFIKDLIEISALALDCSGSLVDVVGFTNPAPIPFNRFGTETKVITNGYLDIFVHTLTSDCIIQKCTVK